jgi:hypothetical protein
LPDSCKVKLKFNWYIGRITIVGDSKAATSSVLTFYGSSDGSEGDLFGTLTLEPASPISTFEIDTAKRFMKFITIKSSTPTKVAGLNIFSHKTPTDFNLGAKDTTGIVDVSPWCKQGEAFEFISNPKLDYQIPYSAAELPSNWVIITNTPGNLLTVPTFVDNGLTLRTKSMKVSGTCPSTCEILGTHDIKMSWDFQGATHNSEF